jgi:hypothetical protein
MVNKIFKKPCGSIRFLGLPPADGKLIVSEAELCTIEL